MHVLGHHTPPDTTIIFFYSEFSYALTSPTQLLRSFIVGMDDQQHTDVKSIGLQ